MEASPTFESAHPVTSRLLAVQPDAVLCRLAARGNAQAFDALYQRYRQPVFAFVFHLLGRGGGAEDAEDITQETFAKAFSGISAKHDEGSFKAWLYTIARNRTLDSLRARRRSTEVSLDAEEAAEPVMPPEGETAARAEERAQLGWLVSAVGELPERQREALLLREFGGMSHTEIAGELGTTVSATKKLIGRGREQVTASASANGYRGRRLGRDLAMAAPVLPIAAAGVGFTLAGGGAAAAGGGFVGGKAAATMLAVIAVGGAAAVEQPRISGENKRAERAATERVAETADRGVARQPVQLASATDLPVSQRSEPDDSPDRERRSKEDERDRSGDRREPRDREGSAREDRDRSGDRDRAADGAEEDRRGRGRGRSGDESRTGEMKEEGPRENGGPEDQHQESDSSGPGSGEFED